MSDCSWDGLGGMDYMAGNVLLRCSLCKMDNYVVGAVIVTPKMEFYYVPLHMILGSYISTLC